MSEEGVREGGCGCGAVRFRITGEPIMVHNCHCRICQQETGSTSVVHAFWESDRVELLQGALTEFQSPGGSGQMHTLCQCEACGNVVIGYYPRAGRLVTAVRAGALDDPDSVTPDAVIFTESAMPWVALPEGIPHFAQYYDFREVLSEDSQQRLSALVARRQAGEG